MISEDLRLVRLVWHPAHFDGEKLIGSAFDSADLIPCPDKHGNKRYLSLDEKSRISKPSVDWRIENQQKGEKREKCRREEARFAEFLCGHIVNAVDSDGIFPFSVTEIPLEHCPETGSPENPAHCGIHQITEKTKSPQSENSETQPTSGHAKKQRINRDYIEELRTILLKLHISVMKYSDLFTSPQTPRPSEPPPSGI